MALTIKTLCAAAVPENSTTTLYTVPSDKSAIIESIMICNNSSTNQVTTVKLTVSGTTVQLRPDTTLSTAGTPRLAITEKLTLATGNVISCTIGTGVGELYCLISGVERDV